VHWHSSPCAAAPSNRECSIWKRPIDIRGTLNNGIFKIAPIIAVNPGHLRFERCEEVVDGVAYDDTIVGGHEERDDHAGESGS